MRSVRRKSPAYHRAKNKRYGDNTARGTVEMRALLTLTDVRNIGHRSGDIGGSDSCDGTAYQQDRQATGEASHQIAQAHAGQRQKQYRSTPMAVAQRPQQRRTQKLHR